MVTRQDKLAKPHIFIVTIFRESGHTGVHTHFRQVYGYLQRYGTEEIALITPFSWSRPLTYIVFAPRLMLKHISPPVGVLWYRYWHELFLYQALCRELGKVDECVVYAQGPLEARAALRARRGPHQLVVLAVHFRSSQADEHAEPGRDIKSGGATYRAIQRLEREAILQVDGLVYVSAWARDALLAWLPEAANVRSAVIGNAVDAPSIVKYPEKLADIVTVGRLDTAKNHRFLLQVLAAAKETGRNLTLDIYGDGPLRNELTRQIGSLGLTGQVRLQGFRSDVRQILPAYRAYVHASYAETSSLAIIEAMAAGLPIVAVGIGPVSELCDDGVEARFLSLIHI